MTLTCKNHPNLRWSCKDIAWTVREDGSGYYNGSRNLFFIGAVDPTREGGINHYAAECPCPGRDLVAVRTDDKPAYDGPTCWHDLEEAAGYDMSERQARALNMEAHE